MLRLGSRPTGCSTGISIIASALLALGVVMVFSASASLSSTPISEGFFKNSSVRQALFSCAALVVMLMVGLCPYETWGIRAGRVFQPVVAALLITIALLVVVLIPGIGEVRNGARRWVSLGPAGLGLGFQPSEVAKLTVVLFTAAAVAYRGPAIRKFWSGLIPLLLVLGAVGGLIGKEDFGTAALVLGVGVAILAAAGARIWHLAIISLPVIAGGAYLISMKEYRLQRLTSFLNPDADPQGAGYHQMQSLITIASGGWWGRGLGAGIQKYGYLPEARSDFIFSVICEELGLVGGIAVIGLFVVLLWQGRRAMVRAGSEFGRLLAFGATLTIGFQAAMNIAVVTVSVPTKGIGLPLVSAGGSGVVLLSVLMGLLVNVARHRVAAGASIESARPQVPAEAQAHLVDAMSGIGNASLGAA